MCDVCICVYVYAYTHTRTDHNVYTYTHTHTSHINTMYGLTCTRLRQCHPDASSLCRILHSHMLNFSSPHACVRRKVLVKARMHGRAYHLSFLAFTFKVGTFFLLYEDYTQMKCIDNKRTYIDAHISESLFYT